MSIALRPLSTKIFIQYMKTKRIVPVDIHKGHMRPFYFILFVSTQFDIQFNNARVSYGGIPERSEYGLNITQIDISSEIAYKSQEACGSFFLIL